MAIYNTNISGGINAKDCTADASKILDGYTAAVGKEIIEGTMPNNGNVDSAIANGVLKEGYTSGGQIENLTAENIKKDIPICGMIGNYQGEAAVGLCQISSDELVLTIHHNLGYKPKHFMFYPASGTALEKRYILYGYYFDVDNLANSPSYNDGVIILDTVIGTKGSSNTGWIYTLTISHTVSISDSNIIITITNSDYSLSHSEYYYIAY